ncbi:beta-ketoacyl-[acyl-carrier-protein] synthase family protein [Haloflavibacter putidus]|uniref:Beta-ketoacyl-[acyl-carrier-protein] synthase family protein n=1 Tax=Haloflavibacter putidus TaxID=2576776 RepID=A0A507ZZV2_9FLAO|nr:beta-ketoacyl-[acyl-carrier-protein] synthase family protein [Haloflavibacter putidus]TQD40195.1 beta-ketoacyl-[acyl-carrier-protein] synthase family protein [Haloflavibacter putidus]
MKTRVAITGMGVISAIGNTVAENFASLCNSESGLRHLDFLDTKHANNYLFGEVKQSNTALVQKLNLPNDNNFTRGALLASLAAKEALKNANLENLPRDLAFINATSVGGMDYTEKYYRKFSDKQKTQKYIEAQHPGFTTDVIAAHLGCKNLVTTISTACSSSANAILTGTKLIETNKAKQVLVGGTDCLSKFTINGFKSLLILSEKACKAFDENRDGLNLGEAAAYLVLESEETAKQRNQPILSYCSGYANANDAYHQTASSATGEGNYLAIQQALQKANLDASQIDYILAHGTATINNDVSEGKALQRIFKNFNLPPVSSTKAFTGHTLGAAGAVEAVFAILALQKQVVFKNLNFKNKMPETSIKPVEDFQTNRNQHVLSNSFGFGGNCTSLIFSKA